MNGGSTGTAAASGSRPRSCGSISPSPTASAPRHASSSAETYHSEMTDARHRRGAKARTPSSRLLRLAFLLASAGALCSGRLLTAQDRLRTFPRYEEYARAQREFPRAVRSGALAVNWTSDTTFEYSRDGKHYRFDVVGKQAAEVPERAGMPASLARSGHGYEPERGRQYGTETSPDGTRTATYRDRNVYLTTSEGREIAVTTDGSAAARIKYGTASWVYGEELNQRTAMWWSPDGRKLAYYRFDESKVPDYLLTVDETATRPRLDAEAFPLAGDDNPIVDLFIYNVDAQTSVRVDVRDGQPFSNDVVGHYVYRVEWTADGSELLFLRSNRRQNVMEIAAADPATGKCRTVLREQWPTGWLNEDPRLVFLSDGRRF